MIAADGTIKVMDFGIARAIADANATMTQTQAVIGTAQYLSPEQAQGHQSTRGPTCTPPAACSSSCSPAARRSRARRPVSIAYQHVGEQPPAPSHAESRHLRRPRRRRAALAGQGPRDARYQSAAEFRADLQAARLGRPISDAARGSAAALAGDRARAPPPPRPCPTAADETEAYAGAPVAGPGTATLPPGLDPTTRTAKRGAGSCDRAGARRARRARGSRLRVVHLLRRAGRPPRSPCRASSTCRTRRPPPSS